AGDRLQQHAVGILAADLADTDRAVAALQHHAVAAADLRRGRDHDDVAVAVDRVEVAAADLDRKGAAIVYGAEAHAAPGLALGLAVGAEAFALAHALEHDDRQRTRLRPGRHHAIAGAVVEAGAAAAGGAGQLHEAGEALA